MAKQYILSHTLPYDCDFDIPPIEKLNLISLTLSPAEFGTPSIIENSVSGTGFQDWT